MGLTANLEHMPKLGFGCMRLPRLDADDDTKLDVEQVKQMVDAFLDAGLTYFDTAWCYGDGASERALGEALVKRHPRENYTIATKCMAWAVDTAEQAKAQLTTSLERLGTEYVDYYLLHNLGGKRTQKFEDYGIWDYISQKKEAGVIRYIGFSWHDRAEGLRNLLQAHPEVDFVQLQVNYLDWEDPSIQSRACMEVAAEAGKPVVIMEPARGGRLANLPEEAAAPLLAVKPDASLASWAYRFCYHLPGVLVMLSGASSYAQMQQNIAEFKADVPFSPEEETALAKTQDILKNMISVPCTGCRYCVDECPQGVMIPEIMSLLNLEYMLKDREFAKGQYGWRTREGRASKCIACGSCESMCPQGIDIIDQLKTAVSHFEKGGIVNIIANWTDGKSKSAE